MSIFKRGSTKSTPPISTASLPDIIFMLLFFFMVTTVMRETELLVKITLPEASEIIRLEDKALVDYIYIGPPVDPDRGTEPLTQLNGQFARLNEINQWMDWNEARRDQKEVPFITRSRKVDKDTRMKMVIDVKQELRRSNALKINYSAEQDR
jgi:hypothetical protein